MTYDVAPTILDAFGTLRSELDHVADEIEGRLVLLSSHPPGFPVPVVDSSFSQTMSELRQLDELMPLVREPEKAVWEHLELLFTHSGNRFLSVVNALGPKETVAVFGIAEPGHGNLIGDWCSSRSLSVDTDSLWGRARSGQRRTSVEDGKFVHLIDPGVYFACDALLRMGSTPYTSCEGHPWGAYLGWHGSAEHMTPFLDSGWEPDRMFETVVRMPMAVDTVAKRDDMWRRTCDALHAVSG